MVLFPYFDGGLSAVTALFNKRGTKKVFKPKLVKVLSD